MECWLLRLDGCLRITWRRLLVADIQAISQKRVRTSDPLLLYTVFMAEQLYAVQPGSVTLYDGTVRTFTALELATAYGVQDEPYLTVNSDLDLPRNPLERMRYVLLIPRQDNKYENIMYTAEDDGEDVAYRPDFDDTKQYIQETDQNNIDSDIDFNFNKGNN
mgnify:CR=1 FL=1